MYRTPPMYVPDTISRGQLMEAARDAIAHAREQLSIPVEVERAVLEVAERAKRITGDWWNARGECGCLIGTLYGPDALARYRTGAVLPPALDAEMEIAAAFPFTLSDQTGDVTLDRYYVVVDEDHCDACGAEDDGTQTYCACGEPLVDPKHIPDHVRA